MKFGMRKPSLKKSFSARTTGKVKRKIKKATNPLYGKKGVGMIKDPKKATYNKIYKKTTISPVSHKSSNSKSKGKKAKEEDDFSGSLILAAIGGSLAFCLGMIKIAGILLYYFAYYVLFIPGRALFRFIRKSIAKRKAEKIQKEAIDSGLDSPTPNQTESETL